jgi:hypothetical protein
MIPDALEGVDVAMDVGQESDAHSGQSSNQGPDGRDGVTSGVGA